LSLFQAFGLNDGWGEGMGSLLTTYIFILLIPFSLWITGSHYFLFFSNNNVTYTPEQITVISILTCIWLVWGEYLLEQEEWFLDQSLGLSLMLALVQVVMASQPSQMVLAAALYIRKLYILADMIVLVLKREGTALLFY
jgi:hypothetical protein